MTKTVEQAQIELAADAAETKTEKALLDLLQSRYTGMTAAATTIACIILEHPDRYPSGQKPKFKPEGCPCGQRK